MLWTQLPRELKVRDVEDFEWVLEMCDRYGLEVGSQNIVNNGGWKTPFLLAWRFFFGKG